MQGKPLFDELIADAWPPLVEELYGGWRYRWTHGVTRRANSALASGSESDLVDLVAHAEAFYGQHFAPTIIQASTASAPYGLAAYLHHRSYQSTARTLVQVATTSKVIERTRPTLPVEIANAPGGDWFRAYWTVESSRCLNDAAKDLYRDVLLAPRLPKIFASALHSSETAGVGQLVIERGWAGVQCMATSPRYRRNGVASSILNTLAKEAAGRGIKHMYLAVMADNNAAIALYASASFTTVHEYSYFTRAHL